MAGEGESGKRDRIMGRAVPWAPAVAAVPVAAVALAFALALTACGARSGGDAAQETQPDHEPIICPDDSVGDLTAEIPVVSVEEAAVMIEINPNLVVLDVRSAVEYSQGHLPGAINIDYESGHFTEDVIALDKDAEYLVYCKSGNRSGKAALIMKEHGFTHLVSMAGGITEWTFQYRPTVTES